MTTRITDSAFYAPLWGTAEVRALVDEQARLQGWLDVLVALARAQAAEGVIPAAAADAIAAQAQVKLIDLDYAAAETRRTSHSTLGLIRALTAVLPPEAAEHVYAGATVQDVTDTWTGLVIRRVGGVVWRDLRRVEELLLALAVEYRSTAMAGRTHGQLGAPVTFGWKAASWADEVRRHLDRLREGAPRWLVGQLGGGTGTLVFYRGAGLAVRSRFCAQLGLADPGISWLSARDRVVEFVQLLALVCGTLARIGTEVYELQRPEIGELAEPADAEAVGSITMPHKRNPERSEHLDTLARLVRANAAVMLEGMVQQHERDGRGWKAEWVALPEACLLASSALQLAIGLLDGLQVRVPAMDANLHGHGGYLLSEQVLTRLTPRLGKHAAQERLQQVLRRGQESGQTLVQALVADGLLGEPEARELADRPDTGACAEMVDMVVDRARRARSAEPAGWPGVAPGVRPGVGP